MDAKELNELITIRKELQNIRAILEYNFVPRHERMKARNKKGKPIRILRTLEDPLEKIRKECNIDR